MSASSAFAARLGAQACLSADAACAAPTFDAPRRRRLPRGASSLPRAVVQAEQRKRLVLAMAQVVARKGYAPATVGDISAQAGVSKATFYELFTGKEACFLFGFLKLSQAHARAVEEAYAREQSPPERLQAALWAYFERINADRDIARAFIMEARSATPASRAAYAAIQARFHRIFRRWLLEARAACPDARVVDETAFALVQHGLSGYVLERVRSGEPFTRAELVSAARFLYTGMGFVRWAEQLHG